MFIPSQIRFTSDFVTIFNYGRSMFYGCYIISKFDSYYKNLGPIIKWIGYLLL